MTVRTRQSILLGLLAVLLVWLGWQRLVAGRAGGVSGQTAAARGGDAVGAAPQRIAELNLQQLVPAAGTFQPGRNIFRYGSPAAPAPEASAATPQEAGGTRPGAVAGGTVTAGDQQPMPPPVELRYLGSFGPDSAPIVVFSDGKTITNARQGDVVENRFIVRRIGYESVDLGFVGLPEDVVRRLGPGG